MKFHENRLLANDSHEISYLIFSISKNLSSAAVVIKSYYGCSLILICMFNCLFFQDLFSYITKNVAEMKHLLSYGNSNKVIKYG